MNGLKTSEEKKSKKRKHASSDARKAKKVRSEKKEKRSKKDKKEKRKKEKKAKNDKKDVKTATPLNGEIVEETQIEVVEEKKDDTVLMSDYRIPENIVSTLRNGGITEMFEIQKRCFDHIFDGKDLVGRAHTGEGKTLAFVLPILSKLRESQSRLERRRRPRVLALCPVRELAMQVAKVFDDISFDLQTLCIYGGTAFGPQLSVLRSGCDIVVGTVGRVKDLIEKNHLQLNSIEFVVLDEADEMLNIGFSEDVEWILSQVNETREEGRALHQTLLFSATLPQWVHTIINKFLKPDKITVDLVGNKKRQAGENIEHMAICCHFGERAAVLTDILLIHAGPKDRVIIFAEKKNEVNEIALNSSIKQECQVLHGDIHQKQREVTIKGFREGKFPVLVATDVAARGLDITGVTLIVQCEPPQDPESYIHRSGRTGRAGAKGKAICFYTPRQTDRISAMERKAGVKFRRIGAPQLKDLVKATADDSVKSIKKVSEDMISCFKDEAKELIDQFGAENAVSAALAAISGYTKASERRSLLTCSPSQATLYAKLAGESAQPMGQNEMMEYVRNVFGHRARTIKNLTMTDDKTGCVFDVPVHMISFIKTFDPKNQYHNQKLEIKLCEELPPLATLHLPGSRGTGRSNGYGGGWRGRNGGGGGGWRRNSGGYGRSQQSNGYSNGRKRSYGSANGGSGGGGWQSNKRHGSNGHSNGHSNGYSQKQW